MDTSLCRRRDLLFAAGLGLGALTGVTIAAESTPIVLRPPGAREHFLAACIRCGKCIEACPYGVLRAADTTHGAGAGAPFFVARTDPCRLCEDSVEPPCASACPTSALEPIVDRRRFEIGTAELDESICFAFNGVSCRACWHACPYPDEAIVLDSATMRPHVAAEACIGCGLCEHACLTETSSIVVRPRR